MSQHYDLMDIGEVCRLLGGVNRPVHPSTVYRMVRDGRLSPPLKVGPATSRWNRPTVVADMARFIGDGVKVD